MVQFLQSVGSYSDPYIVYSLKYKAISWNKSAFTLEVPYTVNMKAVLAILAFALVGATAQIGLLKNTLRGKYLQWCFYYLPFLPSTFIVSGFLAFRLRQVTKSFLYYPYSMVYTFKRVSNYLIRGM